LFTVNSLQGILKSIINNKSLFYSNTFRRAERFKLRFLPY